MIRLFQNESRSGSRGRLSRLVQSASISVFIFLAVFSACAEKAGTQKAGTDKAVPPASTNASSTPASRSASSFNENRTFNENRAMQYVKEIAALGPRPIGSVNHKKVEDYLLKHLKDDTVESDSFNVHPSEGEFPVHNIIVKYPGTKDGVIVIASHYDTNYPLRNTSYIGANDGASSSALLLEIANQLRGKKLEGYSIWLLWDDAEESMQLPWVDAESLYGVRHIAEKWKLDGTLKKIKAFILADMVGDADLNIERPQNSTPWLEDMIYQAATNLGYQSHFFARTGVVGDDHVPFLERGVPSADLIDFDYGYNNVFWHTTQDTVDKLSPKSLQIVGSVILETVYLLNQR